MKFPVIGGVVFLLSGAGALAAMALMDPPAGEEMPIAASASCDASPVIYDAPADGSTLVFSVPDMHCEFACAPKVRETLAAVPGVEKVETDVEKQTATVVTGDGFDVEKAITALQGAGYPAKAAE